MTGTLLREEGSEEFLEFIRETVGLPALKAEFIPGPRRALHVTFPREIYARRFASIFLSADFRVNLTRLEGGNWKFIGLFFG